MAEVLQPPSTGKPPPHFPDDVLIQILIKLPARSLFLFRSVSRNWLRLIHSIRSLIKSNHNNAMLVLRKVSHIQESDPQNPNYNYKGKTVLTLMSDDETLAYREDVPLEVISPSMAGRGSSCDMHLLGPCNGLFCITDAVEVVVFNPAIRSRRKVPRSPLSGSSDCGWFGYFNRVGFGYDPKSDDYKLVKFHQVDQISDEDDDDSDDNDDDDDDDDGDYDDGYSYASDRSDNYAYKAEIYSLRTNRWKEFDVTLPDDIPQLHSYNLFFNGAFHWIGGDEGNIWSILVFDLKKEAFKKFSLPEGYMIQEDIVGHLSILNESLAFIVHRKCDYGLDSNDGFEIWIMKKYGVRKSWRELYHITPGMEIERPLSFGKDGEILLENRDGQLVSFNLKTRAIKEFQVHGASESIYAFRYQESLVSLKGSKKKRKSK